MTAMDQLAIQTDRERALPFWAGWWWRMPLRTGAVLLCAAAYYGQTGEEALDVDLINGVAGQLLVAAITLVSLAIVLRERVALIIGLAALLVLSVHSHRTLFDTAPRATAADGPVLTVMTVSTYHANPDPAAIVPLLAEHDPDIAFLQETNGTARDVLPDMLPDHYRTGSCAGQICALTILSRWPIADIPLPPGRTGPSLMGARIDAPGGAFTVANIHFPRPMKPEAQPFTLDALRALSLLGGEPLILGGDFNLATGMFRLQAFERASGLKRADAFAPTYPAHTAIPAVLGIDHIMVSEHWRTLGCRALPSPNSDHRPVLCRIALRR